MAYVKWVANADRHNDWTTELRLEDGTVIRMGEPVELTADLKKRLEGRGRIFEDSSADEAKEFEKQTVRSQVGNDVAGSAPVFENAGPQNQGTEPAGESQQKSNDKK